MLDKLAAYSTKLKSCSLLLYDEYLQGMNNKFLCCVLASFLLELHSPESQCKLVTPDCLSFIITHKHKAFDLLKDHESTSVSYFRMKAFFKVNNSLIDVSPANLKKIRKQIEENKDGDFGVVRCYRLVKGRLGVSLPGFVFLDKDFRDVGLFKKIMRQQLTDEGQFMEGGFFCRVIL